MDGRCSRSGDRSCNGIDPVLKHVVDKLASIEIGRDTVCWGTTGSWIAHSAALPAVRVFLAERLAETKVDLKAWLHGREHRINGGCLALAEEIIAGIRVLHDASGNGRAR